MSYFTDIIKDSPNIIKGHVNEMLGLNKDISEVRMNICKACPIFSPKFGGMCNRKLWLDPKTNDVSFEEKEGYIRGCGCKLPQKTSVIDEFCNAGKW